MNNRKKYPKDWKKKATECKEAAGWRCTKCQIEQGTELLSWSGRVWKVYMVAAHANHDPHNPMAVLVCVCPRCHWRYYRANGHRPAWIIERLKHQKLLQKRGYR